MEISREKYEEMIHPLLEQTLDSASKALSDAGLLPQAVDAVLLVGGSTRTPLVLNLLEKMCGKAPRQDLHPDLCVALGAGVLASRLGGHEVERVLVDVSPYSFGPSYLGVMDDMEYPHCYHPVIRRNTPLPVTRTEQYSTAYDYQTAVEIDVYQGDDPDALRNVHVGHFRIDGLTPVTGPNPVLCRMRLDLDGILHVTAIEKKTGLSKHVAITGATRPRDTAELAQGREEIERLFAGRVKEDTEVVGQSVPPVESAQVDAFGSLTSPGPVGAAPVTATEEKPAPAAAAAAAELTTLIARCRERIPSMHPDDQEEAIGLIEDLENASQEHQKEAIEAATKALNEFLFFVEGR